jgi:DNA-binding NarL/FixJ family response regulator
MDSPVSGVIHITVYRTPGICSVCQISHHLTGVSMKILIVDDHAVVRAGIRSLLASVADWSVVGEASDGAEAILKAKALNPDIVLMDISMPIMNGLEATDIIRREIPHTAVVIVSQNDPSLVRGQDGRSDVTAYVPKVDISRKLIPTLQRLAADRNARSSRARY